MFISRVPLNPRRREARFLLRSPQAMHAAVMSSFPPGTTLDGESGRVLWRIDRGYGESTWLIVVSPNEPELLHIAEQAGWPTQHLGESKPYGDFITRIATGQEWAFTVTANPTRTVTDDQGLKKRLAHVTVTQQRDWFRSKSTTQGFTITQNSVGDADLEVRERATQTFTRQTASVTLGIATFIGRLRISDEKLFQNTLRHGIGRAKGYGCGLLLLSKLPNS
ncbi:type I-E CRISPR-associated protein Cas6/Cse3/CasE [Rathayibacter toxicus]|uniref:type I-E CRISPR-associated protein Cas6/Cse3/CasE n=1 Tax=Rathayibacter toxicus TaxID=145458 RepID=UPI000CE82D9A|nr:type I-E CRISPR-associated protein Cas6/Cse3/CasE [Rathayibacter toxicus]PPI56706.1 type I-E CRISPR-associated protein Cas6/Cse3/CasE [Rathayibacter toxicus]QOD10535.1 type I-E CRISPR-associated protein Cas6/Cse3/CasE [Rathayibacter toxicus]QWL27269.1 type I-E CRISPR-associated protein Cas6/Cse3/CasE [Rathayibacter toxicus]